MAGSGPPPKDPSQRRGRSKPYRGDWKPTDKVGWQHGPIPDPPEGLTEYTVSVWYLWFESWFAAHWAPEWEPMMRHAIKLYDLVERGSVSHMPELRRQLDQLGISPKGQQDRRWAPPKPEDEGKPTPKGKVVEGRWGDLKVADTA